jgi:drug/metabolite transporter (DMT)-like permease
MPRREIPATGGEVWPRFAGPALILASAVLFGISPILIKVAYGYGVSPLTVLAWRATLGTASLWAVRAVAGPRGDPFRSSLVPLVAIGTTLVPAQVFTYYLALASLPASSASVLANTYPLHVAWMAWVLLGEYIRLGEVVLLIGVMVGAILVANQTPTAGTSVGFIAIFIGTLISALYIVTARRLMRDVSPLAAMAVMLPSSAVVYWCAGLATGQLVYPIAAPAVLAIVGTGAATSVAALLQLGGLRRIAAARAAILGTLEPVVTVCLSVLLLRDLMTPLRAAGIAIVIAGIAILQLRRSA